MRAAASAGALLLVSDGDKIMGIREIVRIRIPKGAGV